MIQSAVLTTSRLCSTTSTVLPASTKSVQHLQQQLDVGEVQAGGRLVEQIEGAAGAFLHQFAGELHRCASPPERVGDGWPSFM